MKKANEIQKAFEELNAKYLYALKCLQKANSSLCELNELKTQNESLKGEIAQLKKQLAEKPKEIEKLVEVTSENDLVSAAKIMARSELNKEDLSESEILEFLRKSSDDEIKRKMGFWAVPLPRDESKLPTNKKYIGKK